MSDTIAERAAPPPAESAGDPGAAPAAPRQRVYLIDGSGFIFRAFHALPPMTRSDGTPVNAVYGFTTMLLKLLDDATADHIAVIFDAGRESFRNAIYPAYKAQRPEPPPELIPQFALIREATRACNVPQVELPGYEADDLIATYAGTATAAGHDVIIVSSDKDLMQLVGDGVTMLDPIRNRTIGEAEVREKFGVGPDRVVDVQALAGDSVDNVPGVPGIGVKTAADLIAIYGDLDTLLERAAEIRRPKRRQTLLDNAAMARTSRDLVRLCREVPVPEPLDAFVLRQPDYDLLLDFLKAQEFKSLAARIESRRQTAVAAAAGGTANGGGVPSDAPMGRAASYTLIQSLDTLDDWVARAMTQGLLAVDTETTSLNPMQAELVGISLALAAGEACYIPLGHRAPGGDGLDLDNRGGAPEQIPLEAALAVLKPMLEDPGVLKVGQNLKYDMVVLGRHGIRVAPIDDTMLISYVLDGALHGHGMDELAERHLGHATIPFSEVAGTGKAKITFDRVPLDQALVYAAEDADVTLRLHRLLKPQLRGDRLLTVYETMDRPLAPVLAAMESAGVRVDPEVLRALSADFASRLAALETEIHGLAGRSFNLGSPKQLGEVLFDELGLGGDRKSRKGKTGAYTTGADVLDELAAQGHALPARMLDWRQLAKLKSTYSDALQQQIHPQTGRVHTCFAMAATSTGRLSSTDPNLQNIPIRTEEGRRIRRAFVAEPGHVLLSADYSQIELRLLAHVAEIETLRAAFRDGHDIHAMTASQVFGVPVEGMDPMVRRQAKAINFGIIYGISAFGLARQLGIPQGAAADYIRAYFERYPGIRAYMDRAKAEAREHGMVRTIFGRRCWVPGIQDKNPARRSFAERQAINAPLQGSAADIIKRAMVRIPAALAAEGLRGRMLLQVHDELLFEVPEAEAAATAALAKRVMEAAAVLSVPLVVETGTGASWAEAH